jgi:chaperonin GroEL (HSP60 family)
MRVEMEDPDILIYEKKLSALNELLPLLEAVVQASSVAVVTDNFLHKHHDIAPQMGILNSRERSDQP